MIKIKELLLVSIFYLNSFVNMSFLPDNIQMKIGMAYDNNYLNFSDYEMNHSDNRIAMLGDSKTFDSPIVKYSLNSTKYFNRVPVKIELDLGFINHTQSKNKTSFYSGFILSHRLGNYKWIKIGYKKIPKNYLRMYRDRDQIDSDLVSANYKYEKLFSSFSHSLFKKSWFKLQYSKTSIYFNPFFTEFDLLQDELYIRLYNLSFKKIKISPFLKFSSSNNNTYNSGYISNNTDRSYFEYSIGTDFKVKKSFSTIFYYNIKSTINCKLRKYTSEDFLDALHNNREHIQLELMQEINKKINDNIQISYYYKYLNRSTNASNDYIEDLKTFNSIELGVEILLNITDKLYEMSY